MVDREMTDGQALTAAERLPLLEPDFDADAVQLVPHCHRNAGERLVHLLLEHEFAHHE
jgi:hypothetical protein